MAANEEMFEKHLDQVLWHNSERVTSSLQSLLEKTLKSYQKKCLVSMMNLNIAFTTLSHYG